MFVFYFSGWTPIGISCLAFSAMMLLFPRMLPRAAARNKEQSEEKTDPISTGECIIIYVLKYTARVSDEDV